MAKKQVLNPDELRKILDYDQHTGFLTWKPRAASMFAPGKHCEAHAAVSWNTRYANKPALASPDGRGYMAGTIFNRAYQAHRVCWAMHFGQWPLGQIDHINGDRSDNRIANLRDVTPAENMRNQRRRVTNTSGVMGVYWHKRDRKWQARIFVGGRQKHIGYFESFGAAVEARKAAEVSLEYHTGHGRPARNAHVARGKNIC